MRHIVGKETDFEEWDTSCRAEQCCMIIYDLYFTVVDVGGELRLRVSLQENENAYLDFIRKNKVFEVVRRKDISDVEYWRIRFYVEQNKQFFIKDMKTDYYIVDKKTERQPNPMKPEEIAKVKKDYPKNAVIILTEDMYSDGVPEKDMCKGLTGRVSFVDDAGQIHVKWQNGRGLALIQGVDHFQKVEKFIKAYDLMKAAFEAHYNSLEENTSLTKYNFEQVLETLTSISITDTSICAANYEFDKQIDRKVLDTKVLSGYWVFDYVGHSAESYFQYFPTYEDADTWVKEKVLGNRWIEGLGVVTDVMILHDTEILFYLNIYNKDRADFVEYHIKTLEDKIADAKKQPLQTMQTNLGMLFKLITKEVVENTPDFIYSEGNEDIKAKNKLYHKLLQECRVYENTDSYIYYSNEVIKDKTATLLKQNDPITCPETLMFTLKPNNDWVLESLSCVAEGRKLFTQRHQPKLHSAPENQQMVEPFTMVLIMTKCNVDVVYINREG